MKAGKTLPPAVVKELMETRRTSAPVKGFRGRSGRTFSAKLKLVQTDEGKWRVDFDEDWAVASTGADGAAPAPIRAEEAGSDGGDGGRPQRRRATRTTGKRRRTSTRRA